MAKGHSLPFFDPPLLLEEKEVRDSKIIRMQQIGSKKDHIIRFDVSCIYYIYRAFGLEEAE